MKTDTNTLKLESRVHCLYCLWCFWFIYLIIYLEKKRLLYSFKIFNLISSISDFKKATGFELWVNGRKTFCFFSVDEQKLLYFAVSSGFLSTFFLLKCCIRNVFMSEKWWSNGFSVLCSSNIFHPTLILKPLISVAQTASYWHVAGSLEKGLQSTFYRFI